MIEGRAGRGRPGGDDQRECRGELVARERRGDLSNADRIALDAHLEACGSCRMSRALAADFAADSAVEVDDAERIARLSAAARRWGQRRARPPARPSLRWIRRASPLRVVALSLGALLIAGTASATAWWWRSSSRAPEARAAAAAHAAIVTSARPRTWPPARARTFEPAPAVEGLGSEPEPTPQPIAEPTSAAPHTEVTAAAHRTATRPHRRNLALRAPSETAAALLRLAGEARGRGDADVASSLYRRLQREFPDTREAALSAVPWGGILLRQGQAERALQQFDRYLAAEPHGNLLPEALYGRGRALAAVGRGDDESKTWRRLLAETPGSAYESHARRRLDELK